MKKNSKEFHEVKPKSQRSHKFLPDLKKKSLFSEINEETTTTYPEERPSLEQSSVNLIYKIDKLNIVEGTKSKFVFNNDDVHDKADYFCVGFFVSGLIKGQKPQILSNTEGTKSACGHVDCSILPALKPNVIFRLPQKDNKLLEINELVNQNLNIVC